VLREEPIFRRDGVINSRIELILLRDLKRHEGKVACDSGEARERIESTEKA